MPDRLREARATLDRLAPEAGREPATLTISVHGHPADRDLIERLLDADVTRMILTPAVTTSEPEMAREMTRMAAAVLR